MLLSCRHERMMLRTNDVKRKKRVKTGTKTMACGGYMVYDMLIYIIWTGLWTGLWTGPMV